MVILVSPLQFANMKPLIVLITVFVISLFVTRYTNGDYLHFASGSIAMAAMLAFTAIGHFAFTDGMSKMIPHFIPFKKAIVYLTALIEIAAAILLLFPEYRQATGWFLIAFFIMLLPANIYAAINHIDYQKGCYSGGGKKYLWFRVPLQIFFILWVCFFILTHPNGCLWKVGFGN